MPDGVYPPPRKAGWQARYLALLGSPAFQRWAMRFPLTRPIARHRARALFDLTAGFVYSQILAACVQLDLFEALRHAPRTPADLAAVLDLPLPATERLLRAAAALDLVAPTHGGAYMLGSLGAALLGNPGVRGLIAHHALLYRDLADPVGLLRGQHQPGGLASYWPYAGAKAPASLGEEQVAAYSALMAASNGMIADQVLAAYDIARHTHLLDVGGGEGAFLIAAAARAPRLRLSLFDLPAVAALAEQRLAEAGLGARASAVGGDFFTDSLPGGADLVTALRVIHDHDDAAAATLLRRIRAALPPGGTLLLAEPMAEAAGAAGDAYFGFYLLAMGSGRPRPAAQLVSMLVDAGFDRPSVVRTAAPMLTGLIVARVQKA